MAQGAKPERYSYLFPSIYQSYLGNITSFMLAQWATCVSMLNIVNVRMSATRQPFSNRLAACPILVFLLSTFSLILMWSRGTEQKDKNIHFHQASFLRHHEY